MHISLFIGLHTVLSLVMKLEPYVVLYFVYRVLPLEGFESVKVQGIRVGLLSICGHEWQAVALYSGLLYVC